MTEKIKAVGALRDDASPAPVKKLSLKEVARRFEAGSPKLLEDYRERNLGESHALQATLASMPRGKALVKELIHLAQELQGRVAGRNSDDAAEIKDKLAELQAQWKSLEQSTKQAAQELTEKAAVTAAVRQDTDQDTHLRNRIEQLEDECAALRTQVAERDVQIQHLRRDAEAAAAMAGRQKENGASEASGATVTSANAATAQPSPAKPAAAEETASPSIVRSLAITGRPAVGHTLQIAGSSGGNAPKSLPLQWLRSAPDAAEPSIISGAVRHQYSPEVADVGCFILCRVSAGPDADTSTLKTAEPISAEPELDEEAARLEGEGGTSFFVVPVQHNGQVQRKRTVATLRVDAQGLSLKVADTEIAAASYHADMQVCGARGGGDGAAQGMFLALSPQHVFMLALETPGKRNVCISLVRKMAKKCDLELEGPRENT